MKKICIILFSLLCLSQNNIVLAQSSPNLSVLEDRKIYRDLETLIGFGLLPDAIQAQRPWSVGEVMSFLDEANTNLAKSCDKKTSIPCADLKEHLKTKIQEIRDKVSPFVASKTKTVEILSPKLQTSFYYLDSSFVDFPASNGVGQIDAQFNPLTDNFAGKNFTDGVQYALDLRYGLQITPYFAAFAQNRFENLFPTEGSEDNNHVVQNLYGKFQYKNLQLQIGRDSLAWGQSEFGGLLLSNHARPLDMILIGNDTPFHLPWFFRHVGLVSASMFAARLDSSTYFPNSWLLGYKFSAKPANTFEVSLSNLVMMGGSGAPTSSMSRTIGDFFGFSSTAEGTSNRIIGFDAALTIPRLRHTRFYLESFFDDKSFSFQDIEKNLTDFSAHTFGIYLPRLDNRGLLKWRFEVNYTSPLIYRHWQYRNGMTFDRQILGDPLGPDGYRFSSTWYWDLHQDWRLDFSTTWEGRDSNTYRNDLHNYSVVSENPTDKRLRNAIHLERDFSKRITVNAELAHEHVWDFAFINDAKQNNYFLGLSATFDFADLHNSR